MHCSNTFVRTPDVTYIFSHAGGIIPYLAGRFAIVDEMNVIPGAENRASAAETFHDTALSWSDPVLAMLRSAVGIDRVLFGTDYPYLRRDLAVSASGHHCQLPRADARRKDRGAGGYRGNTHSTVYPTRGVLIFRCLPFMTPSTFPVSAMSCTLGPTPPPASGHKVNAGQDRRD